MGRGFVERSVAYSVYGIIPTNSMITYFYSHLYLAVQSDAYLKALDKSFSLHHSTLILVSFTPPFTSAVDITAFPKYPFAV